MLIIIKNNNNNKYCNDINNVISDVSNRKLVYYKKLYVLCIISLCIIRNINLINNINKHKNEINIIIIIIIRFK